MNPAQSKNRYRKKVAPDLPEASLADYAGAYVTADRSTSSGWWITAKKFNSGNVEIVSMELHADDQLKKGGGGKRKSKTKKEMDEVVLNKSQARAKKKIRHALYQICADRMLTLTYRDNQTDIKQAWKDFDKFRRLMHERFPKRWAYVAVPEYQKRGAVHFHLAVKGFYHANTIRKLWRQVVGQGNIDLTSPKSKAGAASWNPKRIGRYLSKYISKNDSVEINRKRYSTSKINPPESLHGWLFLGATFQYDISTVLEEILLNITGQPPEEHWDIDSYFKIVGCYS